MESVMAAIPFSFSPWLDIRMLSSFLDKLHVFSGSGADVRLTPWWEDTSLAHTCAVVSASLSQGKGVGHIRGLLPSGEGWRVQGQRGLSRHAGPAGVGISLLALGKECQTSSLAPISTHTAHCTQTRGAVNAYRQTHSNTPPPNPLLPYPSWP